jgi:hypothetical protein
VPEHHVLLENGTEEGSKASAGIALGASALGVMSVSICIYELDNKHNPALDASQATVSRPDPGSLTDSKRLRPWKISMESLILAQDERWRRA